MLPPVVDTVLAAQRLLDGGYKPTETECYLTGKEGSRYVAQEMWEEMHALLGIASR